MSQGFYPLGRGFRTASLPKRVDQKRALYLGYLQGGKKSAAAAAAMGEPEAPQPPPEPQTPETE